MAKEVLEKLEENDSERLQAIKSLIRKTKITKEVSSSKEEYSDFCIHSAFEGPDSDKIDPKNVPDRESIEIRCFALFE